MARQPDACRKSVSALLRMQQNFGRFPLLIILSDIFLCAYRTKHFISGRSHLSFAGPGLSAEDVCMTFGFSISVFYPLYFSALAQPYANQDKAIH